MRNMKNAVLCVATIILFLLVAAPCIATEYELIDLGVLPATFADTSCATAINDLGQVVGWGDNFSCRYNAFIWTTEDGMQELGMYNSWATGINDSGQVVGYQPYTYPSYEHAFLWTADDGFQDLGTLPGCDYSAANGINNLGWVVGWCFRDFIPRAFLWTPENGMEDLGSLSEENYAVEATAINDSGQIVGLAYVGELHAFLWAPGSGMENLGTPPGWQSSIAHGINNLGWVVGRCYGGFVEQAFLWAGGWQPIGTLPGGSWSIANGINDLGQVVGWSNNTPTGDIHPFVWTAEDGMQELPLPAGGDYPAGAMAINNLGQIVGFYDPPGSDWKHACMWKPVTPEAMLAELDEYIQEHALLENIESELETSLLAKVDAATAALDRGNLNTAENQLNALINQVEAQKGKKITVEAAEEIIRLAEEIIEALSG